MRNSKKKNSKIKYIFLLVILIVVISSVGSFFFYNSQLQACGDGSKTIQFEINEGEDIGSVLNRLESEGVIRNELAAKLYIKLGNAGSYYAGTFELNDGMTTPEVLDYIQNEDNIVQDYVVLTVPEGTWAKDIASKISELYPQYTQEEILAKWNDINYIETLAQDYEFISLEALNNNQLKVKLEGYLFPETYHLDPESDIDTITRTFLDQFDSFYKENKDSFDSSTYSVHELVTLASIVQFESGSIDDMKTISGVFYNRLEAGMNLESSVTVCYALYEQFDNAQACETETDIDSPYNTYLYAGLPIGPILNPGKDALLAVLHPEDTEYYFFAADINGDGTVYYSTTYEEHLKICEELGLILN